MGQQGRTNVYLCYYTFGILPATVSEVIWPKGVVDTADAFIKRPLLMAMERCVPFEMLEAVLLIWLAGAVVFAGWHLYCYRKFFRQLWENSIPVPEYKVAVLLSLMQSSIEHPQGSQRRNRMVASFLLLRTGADTPVFFCAYITAA